MCARNMWYELIFFLSFATWLATMYNCLPLVLPDPDASKTWVIASASHERGVNKTRSKRRSTREYGIDDDGNNNAARNNNTATGSSKTLCGH